MSDKVTVDEQERMGLRRPRPNVIQPAAQAAPLVRRMSEAETAALQGLTQGIIQPSQSIQLPQAPQGTHSGHIRHTDDPITNAMASLRYSLALGGAAALTIAGLLLLATLQGYLQIGFPDAIGIEIVGTGIVTLVVMIINRAQGLHHSATGIAHHEIKATVKNHARAADVEEYRIDADKEVRLAEIQVRRELGQGYLKHLEGGKNHDSTSA